MSKLTKFIASVITGGMVHSQSNSLWSVFRLGLLSGTKFNYAGKVGDGQDASVIMAPVMWIAKNAVQAPVEVLKIVKGEAEHQDNHEMVSLLRKPNPFYSGKQLMIGTIICLLTAIDAYWVKIRDNRGKVAELWLIPSPLITPKTLPGNQGSSFIDFYSYQPGFGEIKLVPEDVVHFRIGINPRDARHGINPIYSMLREIYSDTEAANFTGALLSNMGIPGVIISPKDKDVDVQPDDAKAIKEKFIDTFGGDRRGTVMVNTVGVNVDQFGFNPKNLVLDKLRNISEERVCAMLGVAASVIGFGTGLEQTKVGATAAEARRSSWEDGIIPYLDVMADTLDQDLLPDFERDPESFRTNFILSAIRALRESEDAAFKRANTGINGGWLRVDQAQQMAGLDADESQRIYLRRGNLIEVEAGAGVKEGYGVRFASGFKGASFNEYRKLYGVKQRPTTDQARLMAQFARDEVTLHKVIDKELIKFFTNISKDIAAMAKDVLELKQINETQLILDRVDLAAMEQQLKAIFESHYKRTSDTTLNALNNVMGITVGAPDLVAQRIVAEGGRRAGLVDLSNTTRKKLFRILTEAEEAGLGVPETVRRIGETVAAGPWSTVKIRARVIARTETLHAQRESALSTFKQIEDVTEVLVFDARLGETDAECEVLDGQVVSLAEADVLSVEEHPNGTRSFAPMVT